MKMGKMALMAGAAAIAAASTAFAGTAGIGTADANAPLRLAQNDVPASNAELNARLSALEEEVQNAQVRAAEAAGNPPKAAPGWWDDTKVSGRMYFDATNIDNKADGVRVPGGGNGSNFDIKRFYIGIDHTFDAIFSANVTTDATYDGTTGASQLYLKKAYLQARIAPELTFRLGAADLPWVPYAEGLYGMRYFENTLTEHVKQATSSDWGIHMLGSLFDGIVNYDLAAINGGGYKKMPSGGGTNRFDGFDFEGRVSAVYDGFNLGIGGYTGKLGIPYGTKTYHTANRFDVMGAYVADGLRVGVEYFTADDYTPALVQTPGTGDGAHGVSAFASYYFLPQWAVFGRYDSADTSTRSVPAKTNTYYTMGVTWSPARIVDLSLAWKHEGASGGAIGTQNGTIGSNTGLRTGSYNEFGLWGNFQW
jgi:hypothetical protein